MKNNWNFFNQILPKHNSHIMIRFANANTIFLGKYTINEDGTQRLLMPSGSYVEFTEKIENYHLITWKAQDD
jgi:hypothetical protein